MQTCTHNGLTFRIEVLLDHDNPPPWDAEDGHGVVTAWDWRDPTSAELILACDRGARRFYDFEASTELALRDSWGVPDEWRAEFLKDHGREPTEREIARRAAHLDFNRLGAWCVGNWYYVGVVATLLDVDGNPTHETESLYGVESDDDAYIENTVTVELMQAIAERVGDASTITQTFKVRE